MNMEKAIQEIRQFVKDRHWEQFHSEDNLAKSIAIEAGELLECFQWSSTDYDKEAVYDELADVMTYCIQLADKLNMDLETLILRKMEKNKAKYPVDLAKGNAKKYTELKQDAREND